MNEELYMVIADGYYLEGYGSYVDLVGIFYTKERAEEVIASQPEEIRPACEIVKVIIGEVHDMELLNIPFTKEYYSGVRLGGYAE